MNTRGFTLLEMTVVLALMALMSLLIIEGLRFGSRTYARVAAADQAEGSVLAAQRSLRRLLESTIPFSAERAGGTVFGLNGTAAHLSFIASVSNIQGPGALNRYELSVAGHNLVLAWRTLRDGRNKREILIENIEQAQWDYLDTPADAPAVWHATWEGQHALPGLIRIRVIFPSGDSRHWPDLIVAPRITDDAAFSL